MTDQIDRAAALAVIDALEMAGHDTDMLDRARSLISMLKPARFTREDVEKAARKLAPHLEGGREFDQMPPTRIELKKWSREGMCNTNDATQDDALEAATAALSTIGEVDHG